MTSATIQLTPNMVCAITFETRDIGYGREYGTVEGFWTGEIDTWGKHTIRQINGRPALYLFTDEIVRVEDL